MTIFKLSDDFLTKYKGKQPKWGAVGYVTYKRTYARQKPDDTTEEYWETCKRVVEGVFDVQREHCKQNSLPWNGWKSQKSAQQMYDLMWNFKFTPPGRGLWTMGSKIITEKGSACLNNPLGLNTKVLTKEYGWITLGELGTDEKITVLSNTKLYGRDKKNSARPIWTEAKVSHIETQPTKKLTFKNKFGQETTIIASENHRWFRRRSKKDWERVTTKKLKIGDYIPITKPSKYYKLSLQGAQHGFFFGDGTRSTGELHQFKDSINILEKLFTNIDHIDKEHAVVRQCPLAWGKVPYGTDYVDDRRYMYGFLAGYLAADGHVDKKGNVNISSSRINELKDVRNIFETLGIRTLPIREQSSWSNFKEERELYSLGINPIDLDEQFFFKEEHLKRWKEGYSKTHRDWGKLIKIENNKKEEVRCVTVPKYEQFVIDGFYLTSNCAFHSTKNIDIDFAEPFCFMMDMSMLGVGVGGDTKGAGKVTFQEPTTDSEVFVVEDSREGWTSILRKVLNAYIGKEKLPESIDYSQIRPEGTPLVTMGGFAPGPTPLIECIKKISELLDAEIGKKITSDIIVDLFNIIGKCVVSGGIRRTAQIMLGNIDDEKYLDLKNPDKNKEKLYDYRWASNNSVLVNVGDDYTEVANRTAKNGEPGYVWLENAKKFSRMNRVEDNKDYRAEGCNPCGEQTLESGELCCLVETYPSNHDSLEEWIETLKYAYLYAKTVTLIPTHNAKTNSIIMRNRRIGCSMSGITQGFKKFGKRNFLNAMSEGYDKIQHWDKKFSDWLGIPRSIKTTSIKPSGTVSLLAGVTPGIHYPKSEYYIRNIRFQKSSPLVPILKDAGYIIEQDKYSPTTLVVSFPVKETYFEKSIDDVSMWEQLENAAQVAEYWADNQVSVTVNFNKDEAKDIKSALELYETRLKSVSFLPNKEHGYEQAPYITITEAEYKQMKKDVKKLNFKKESTHEMEDKFCDGESCQL